MTCPDPNPCGLGCEKRSPTCHATCEKYLEWHERRMKINAERLKQRRADAVLAERSAKITGQYARKVKKLVKSNSDYFSNR